MRPHRRSLRAVPTGSRAPHRRRSSASNRSSRHRDRIVGSSRPGAWLTSRKIVPDGGSSRFFEQRIGARTLEIVDRVDHDDAGRAHRRDGREHRLQPANLRDRDAARECPGRASRHPWAGGGADGNRGATRLRSATAFDRPAGTSKPVRQAPRPRALRQHPHRRRACAKLALPDPLRPGDQPGVMHRRPGQCGPERRLRRSVADDRHPRTATSARPRRGRRTPPCPHPSRRPAAASVRACRGRSRPDRRCVGRP